MYPTIDKDEGLEDLAKGSQRSIFIIYPILFDYIVDRYCFRYSNTRIKLIISARIQKIETSLEALLSCHVFDVKAPKLMASLKRLNGLVKNIPWFSKERLIFSNLVYYIDAFVIDDLNLELGLNSFDYPKKYGQLDCHISR